MADRDLTTLEYIVLGLVSLQPQSGYSIVSFFEDGSYSWSASPGSIYPMLKRLAKQGVIEGELEMTYETRPRKVYTLTEQGGALLDEWLREVPRMRPFYEQREIALLRFQFMENRLKPDEILTWLQAYQDAVTYSDYGSKLYQQGIMKALDDGEQVTPHTQLLMEGHLMEMNALRTWLELAMTRLQVAAAQEQT